jgi:transposase
MKKRNRYEAEFKCRIALEALREEKTISEMASQYGIHPNQISAWKKQALEYLPEVFSKRRQKAENEHEELIAELYRQIGQLKVERDWLKKKSGLIDR